MAKTVKVQNKDGKVLEVTEKAYRVVYKEWGFKLVDGVDQEPENQNDVDFYTLTEEELKKIKNDDLKAFLDKEQIDYPSNANKDELIALIIGE